MDRPEGGDGERFAICSVTVLKEALLDGIKMSDVNQYEEHKTWASETHLRWSLQRCESFARRSCDRAYNARYVPAIVLDEVKAQARQGEETRAGSLFFVYPSPALSP